MFSVLLSRYKNTRESLGELEKARSPNFHLSFYLRNRKHVSCFYRVIETRVEA